MSKYSKMVNLNKKRSNKKVDYAILTIKEMLDQEEEILVCELVKRTGLSRAFFYNNPSVHNKLVEARNQQQSKGIHQKKKIVLDFALERQNEIIKREYEKAKSENQILKSELDKIKKKMKKKEALIIEDL